MVVCHDRYIKDKIVDHRFVFKGHTEVRDFAGNYSDFREYEEIQAEEASSAPKEPAVIAEKKLKQASETNSGLTYNEKKEFGKLEKEIANLEKRKVSLQNKFLENLSGDEIEKTSIELQRVTDEIELKENRYFELGERE